MSMEYIRQYYGVPAKRSGCVIIKAKYCDINGIIVGSKNACLRIRIEPYLHVTGSRKGILTYHPTDNIEYL